MVIKKLFYLSLILPLLGCTINQSTVYGNTTNMKKLTKISEHQAIDIAKEYLIEKGWNRDYRSEVVRKAKLEIWYKYEDGDLGWSKPEENDKYTEAKMWKVIFPPKTNFLEIGFHLFVIVNAETGEVEDAGNYKY